MSSYLNDFLTLKKEILNKTFNNLNDMQKSAVFQVNGPLLILAGAGSGKTTVLVNRIANMVRYGDAYNSASAQTIIGNEEIDFLKGYLASFDSASQEDRDRAAELIGYYPIKPWNILTITFTNKAAKELKPHTWHLHQTLRPDPGFTILGRNSPFFS